MVECKLKAFLSKHRRVITIVINIFIFVEMMQLFADTIIPAAKDIPTAYYGRYFSIEGVVQNDSYLGSKNKLELHNLYIKDNETGEVVYLVVYGENGIKKGTRIVVEYLPHSKEGFLVERE